MGGGINYRVAFGTVLVIAAILRLKGIDNPLLDDQGWRQADTASMAQNMLGKLDRIPDVFFPYLNYDGIVPQRVELEFPFLPYLLAVTWTFFGWDDIWGRLWALGFSLVAVWGIFDLGKRAFSERAGLIAAGIYSVLPLSVYYGRVVMPEPVTQAIGIWALNLMVVKQGQQRTVSFLVPALFMAAAILAKLPQAMLFPVALVLGFWPFSFKKVNNIIIYLFIALMPPVVYYTWAHIGVNLDSQFVSGILTQQVANNRILEWKKLFDHMRDGITFGIIVLALIGAVQLLWRGRSSKRIAFGVWIGISLLYIMVVCVRISLDYYLLPVVPLISLLSGAALDAIDDIPGTIASIVVISLVIYFSTKVLEPKYVWDSRYLIQADWIKENTSPQNVLVLSDAPPMTFYYAQRSGFRLIQSDDRFAFEELAKIQGGEYLVILPTTIHGDIFNQLVRQSFPEVGPGVFRLINNENEGGSASS